MKITRDILSLSSLHDILQLDVVKRTKQQIDAQPHGQISFQIDLSDELQQTLRDKLGLSLTHAPMRWIKGDTPVHVDIGQSHFRHTHLITCTDPSNGFLVFDDTQYRLEHNVAYVFEEGKRHGTLDTGNVPRLCMGPMSETGFAVGSGIFRPGGTTILFRQTSDVQYSVDNGDNWINLGNNYPIAIGNTDTSAGFLKVEFLTDITIDNTGLSGEYKYFIASSEYIQFGSQALRDNGSPAIVNINGVTNYPGLVQNGNGLNAGYSLVNVFNINVKSSGDSELVSNAGWVCQQFFAKGATGCNVANCGSNGLIIDAGGGVVGGYAASNGGNLYILGCYSIGASAVYSGGIVGYNAAQNGGIVVCNRCWSTGQIGQNAGGIFGHNAGEQGQTIALNCYSTGLIGISGGGIYGRLAGTSGQSIAQQCYSRGVISVDAGGIFGQAAASDGGVTSAANCYSNGIVTTSGNGIYGTNKQSGATQTSCYFGDDDWRNVDADAALQGTPSPIVGNVWVNRGTNIPYELIAIKYSPYTTSIILVSGITVSFVNSIGGSIEAGSSFLPAVISNANYSIVNKSGGSTSSYPSITINAVTGVISTTTGTAAGTYTITVRNSGSYNYSTVVLQVTPAPPPPPARKRRVNREVKGYFQVLKCWPTSKCVVPV